jgi:hypothetical protein
MRKSMTDKQIPQSLIDAIGRSFDRKRRLRAKPEPRPDGAHMLDVDARRKRSGKTPEGQVMAAIAKSRKLCPWIEIQRQNTGAVHTGGGMVRFGEAGNADWTGQVVDGPNRGLRLDVEAKAPGERAFNAKTQRSRVIKPRGVLTPSQRVRRNKTLSGGGIYLVVRSGDEFLATMRRLEVERFDRWDQSWGTE